ncbi:MULTISPECIES: acyl-CoA synthetase [unclassified Mycolicibacterium]|uniref:acyl-CoA synthetase n=1 Tax=unclassified Mycolicibacterium TaxID=2636767 RepID=UPI002ED8ADD5
MIAEMVPLQDHDLPATTYDLLVRSATRHGDKPALRLLGDGRNWRTATTWTYNSLLARVTQAANMYTTRLGLPAGGVVGILLPNTAASYPALLGAQAVGIANPVNPMLATAHIIDILRLTGAQILVAPAPKLDPQAWQKAQEILEDLPNISALVTVGGEVPEPPERWAGDFDELSFGQNATQLNITERRHAMDIAAYFHTGGTTGTPKVAPHTHAGEIYVAWALSCHGAFGGAPCVLSGLPLFHVNAVLVSTLTPLLAGGTTVALGPLGFRDREALAEFWQIIERYRITTFSTVPTVYASLPSVPSDINISSLRAGIVGAAPLPSAVRADFESATGTPMIEGYGLTEGTCASTFMPLGDARHGSVGTPLPYQRVQALRLDDDGRPAGICPPGEIGMLAISGPAVFPGYLRASPNGPTPDPTGVVVDGWLLTGDLGRVDGDGYVYLAGRAKDLIIRGGHNIDPRLIEEAMLSHRDVVAAAAVPRPDPHSGEVPAVYLVLREGTNPNVDELRQWAIEHCPEPAAVPKFFHILDSIPVTAVGKVHKVPLVHDSVRRVVLQELDEAGLTGEVTVSDDGGRPLAQVSLIDSARPEDHERSRELLSRYGFGFDINESARPGVPAAG